VCGVTALDTLSGRTYQIKSKVVINATGPFSGTALRLSLILF
jgi:glycerol-3-phosphate dehydrogenase